MIWMPSSIDRVARSHSGSTSTSPVPSAAIAFSSWGRPIVLVPEAFSWYSATDRMVWPLAPLAHRVVDPWPVQFNGRDLIFYHFCINALNGAAGGAGGTRGPVPWEMGSAAGPSH